MPDYQDMSPFDRWWNTKGWWVARRLSLDEDTIKKVWQEGYLDGISGGREKLSNLWRDDHG